LRIYVRVRHVSEQHTSTSRSKDNRPNCQIERM
uniref:Kinesin motor domain-containing protein n=1 Tax=Brugia timori TaxID=42155 RepID=A0A0R3R924_9BILA